MININIKCESECLTISNIMSFIDYYQVTKNDEIKFYGRTYQILSSCTETNINYTVREIR